MSDPLEFGTSRGPQAIGFIHKKHSASGLPSIEMAQTSRKLSEQTREGINLLSLTVMGLLFFVIWKTSGFNLNLSPKVVQQVSETYQGLDESAAGYASGTEILTWFIFAAVGIFLHFVNRNRSLYTWARAWPLVVLLALIVLSIMWSSVPDIALRRVVKQLLLMAAVAGIVMGVTSAVQFVRLAVLSTALLMGLNCAAVLLFPTAAIFSTGEFGGFHYHKNTAGQFAMVTVLVWFAAARWSSGKWTRAILFCGTLLWFLFLLGTASRTSIISAAVAILFITPLGYCIRRPVAGVIFGLCTLIMFLCTIFALIAFNISFADIIAFMEGEKTTLTGRALKVWHIAYNVFLDHKLLGTGYGSLWLTGGLAPVEEYTYLQPTPFLLGLKQAHSGYFDILATLGLVGAVVLAVFLTGVIWTDVRALASADEWEDGPLLAELTGFLFVASLLSNVTEAFFLRGGILWVFLVLCYLMLCSIGSPADRKSRAENGETSAAVSRVEPVHPDSRMNP
jgi:O-antigen ligase